MKKYRCPDCGEKFEIAIHEYDEGDFVNCPECNLELVVEVVEGQTKIRVAKEKELDETDFDEFYEE